MIKFQISDFNHFGDISRSFYWVKSELVPPINTKTSSYLLLLINSNLHPIEGASL